MDQLTALAAAGRLRSSLLCHIQYIRELLDKGIIQYLFWIDTRDVIADGLTKGAVDRNALHTLMVHGDLVCGRVLIDLRRSGSRRGSSRRARGKRQFRRSRKEERLLRSG